MKTIINEIVIVSLALIIICFALMVTIKGNEKIRENYKETEFYKTNLNECTDGLKALEPYCECAMNTTIKEMGYEEMIKLDIEMRDNPYKDVPKGVVDKIAVDCAEEYYSLLNKYEY